MHKLQLLAPSISVLHYRDLHTMPYRRVPHLPLFGHFLSFTPWPIGNPHQRTSPHACSFSVLSCTQARLLIPPQITDFNPAFWKSHKHATPWPFLPSTMRIIIFLLLMAEMTKLSPHQLLRYQPPRCRKPENVRVNAQYI